jgi:phage terminase large subunit-like protein
MEILNDSTETKTVHTRTLRLSNAPRMRTNNFYSPDELWQAEHLTIEWFDEEKPVRVVAKGKTESNVGITRSFGWEQMPEWMAEVVKPDTSVAEPEPVKPLVKPKLVRKKIGDRSYNLVTTNGKLVGHVAMTGEYGRDDYPWDWGLTDDLHKQLRATDAPSHRLSGGSSESIRDVVDQISTLIAQYGLKP